MSVKKLPEQFGTHLESNRKSNSDGMFFRLGWKEFTVMVNGETLMQYRGSGITLNDVICRREFILQREWKEAQNQGMTWFKFLFARGDEVVWSGNEVEAVLQPKRPHDLQMITLVVYRFDQTGEKYAARIEGVPSEKTAPTSKPKRVRKSRAKPVVSQEQDAEGGDS